MLTENTSEATCTTSDIAQIVGTTINDGFDYSRVSPSVAANLRRGAELIRGHIRQSKVIIFEIGQQLNLAKQALGHGHFGEWLSAEFNWTERTARNYMRVAEVFGAKTEIVSVLPPGLLYKLSAKSTPSDIVAEVVDELERGKEIDVNAVKTKIAAARSMPAPSSDVVVGREITRAGRAVSPPDDALLGFSAVVLELIRRTKSQKVARFAATSITADELASLGAFLSALANLKDVSDKPEASVRLAEAEAKFIGSDAASTGGAEVAGSEEGVISEELASSHEPTSEAEADRLGPISGAEVVGSRVGPNSEAEAANTYAESPSQEVVRIQGEARQ